MTSFSDLLRTGVKSDDAFRIHVPEDWLQGRSAFGGLQLAFALQAMRELVPDRPLRTVQATFFSPIPPGVMQTSATLLRSGKNTSVVEARVGDGSSSATLVVAVFGNALPSQIQVVPKQPSAPVGEGIHQPFIQGVMPNFMRHFDIHWLRGELPFSGGTCLDPILEISFLDDGLATEGHALAIADLIPPIGFSLLSTPAAGSSITWMIELLTDEIAGLPLQHWRLDATLIAAKAGYTSQSVMLWGPGGMPIALSKQCMMVFDK